MTETGVGGLQRRLWGVDADDPGRRIARIRSALQGARARLNVKPSTDRAAWDGVPASVSSPLVEMARSAAEQPWPRLLASDYVRYFRDGNRTAYETNASALRSRTALFVVAAALTDEQGWIDRAADGAVLLCELSTWCWAAHERFSMAAGEVLPDPDRPFVDLGAGEVLALVAWADHVLGERWDERWLGLRRRIRREADLRVFGPFRADRSWHWLGTDEPAHNWTAWIHSNMVTGALLLIDDERTRAETMDLAIAGLDRYVAVIPQDGGCDEGHDYWWNGPVRAVEAFDLLAEASGGAINALTIPVLRESGLFPVRMHLGGRWFVNVADCSAITQPEPWHILHRWGRRVHDAAITALASTIGQGSITDPAGGLGRSLGALVDSSWTDLSTVAEPPSPTRVHPPATDAVPPPGLLPAQSWLASGELLVAREVDGASRGLTLAAKGGHNAERHNHNDVGTYLVAVDGVPVVVDVGRPTYTRETFSDRRYDVWPLQSAWHNVPLLLGSGPHPTSWGQAPGLAHRARHVEVELSDGSATLALEGSSAYTVGLETWQRWATLDRQSSQVRVHDRWLSGPGYRVALVHVLHGMVELDAVAGRAVVSPVELLASGRAAVLRWDPNAVEVALEHKEVDDPVLTAVWGDQLSRLLLVARGGVEELLVTVEASSGARST